MEHVFAGVEVAGLEKVEADADAAAGEAAENVDLECADAIRKEPWIIK